MNPTHTTNTPAETRVTDLGLAGLLFLSHALLRLETTPDGRREFIFAAVKPETIQDYYLERSMVPARSYQRSLRLVRGMVRPVLPRCRRAVHSHGKSTTNRRRFRHVNLS